MEYESVKPRFIIDADALEANLRTLRGVMDRTGCRILLAQKCFSCYALYPLISRYISGTTASGLYEALLAHEMMPDRENHVFSPAYTETDFQQLVTMCNHMVFNSPRQLQLYAQRARRNGLHTGLRVNPECSTQEGHAIYDPCAPGSRLGTTLASLDAFVASLPSGETLTDYIDGIHFHTLCEQNSDDLHTTLQAVETRFGKYLSQMKWINFGGGHHITRSDYDITLLEQCIRHMQTTYGLQVYLEPGEAIALNAGELQCNVLEVQPAGPDGVANVIVSASAACHMPDVIEMPYTPPILKPQAAIHTDVAESQTDTDANQADATANEEQHSFVYRLGGPTCLSGDVIGTYRFSSPLHAGDQIVFGDMAIYSMVKTNTFNGMPLPDIYIRKAGTLRLWKSFGYDEFKRRI